VPRQYRFFGEVAQQTPAAVGHPLKDAHAKLDAAVREAYGMTPKQNVLAFLLALNAKVANAEAKGAVVQAPGLPNVVTAKKPFVTTDALQP
jgi:hypothetical protein